MGVHPILVLTTYIVPDADTTKGSPCRALAVSDVVTGIGTPKQGAKEVANHERFKSDCDR